MTKKKGILFSTITFVLFIIFTILVSVIDVGDVNGTTVGFSSLNSLIFSFFGTNIVFYIISEILGYLAIAICLAFAIYGFIQAIQRKSIAKVDREILALGIFYIVVIAFYVLFELFVINCRPNSPNEASYPSSHTVLALCVFISSAFVINRIITNSTTHKIACIVIALVLLSIVMLFTRLLSGVHWFTDIIGGTLLSIALLTSFYTALTFISK